MKTIDELYEELMASFTEEQRKIIEAKYEQHLKENQTPEANDAEQ